MSLSTPHVAAIDCTSGWRGGTIASPDESPARAIYTVSYVDASITIDRTDGQTHWNTRLECRNYTVNAINNPTSGWLTFYMEQHEANCPYCSDQGSGYGWDCPHETWGSDIWYVEQGRKGLQAPRDSILSDTAFIGEVVQGRDTIGTCTVAYAAGMTPPTGCSPACVPFSGSVYAWSRVPAGENEGYLCEIFVAGYCYGVLTTTLQLAHWADCRPCSVPWEGRAVGLAPAGSWGIEFHEKVHWS